VHHIKRLSDIINEHGITTVVQAIECEAIWDYDNAITLCVSCHAEVDKSILNIVVNSIKKEDLQQKPKYKIKQSIK